MYRIKHQVKSNVHVLLDQGASTLSLFYGASGR